MNNVVVPAIERMIAIVVFFNKDGTHEVIEEPIVAWMLDTDMDEPSACPVLPYAADHVGVELPNGMVVQEFVKMYKNRDEFIMEIVRREKPRLTIAVE